MITSHDDDRVATPSDLARIFDAQDFPIWDRADCLVPDNDQWESHLVALRMMWVTLTMPKPELLEACRSLGRLPSPDGGGSAFERLLEGAGSTEALLNAMLVIIDTGRARLMAAMGKCLEDERDGGADDVRH